MSNQRGAAAVVTAILLVVLIGFTALAVDVGALWWDKKELQNGADAAALALAQGCAQGEVPCPDEDKAPGYAEGNKTGSNVTVDEVTMPTSNSVRVTVASERDFWFAPVLGIDSGDVSASATAAWGGIGSATVIPLTVSNCYLPTDAATGQPTLPGGEILIPIKGKEITDPNCHTGTHYAPGNWGWLRPTEGCSVHIDLHTETEPHVFWAPGDTGNNVPKVCEDDLKNLQNKDSVLLPVFDKDNGEGGSNVEFRLTGFANIEIVAYCFDNKVNHTRPGDPGCPSDRWIKAKFLRMVDLDAEIGPGVDYGATTVQLID